MKKITKFLSTTLLAVGVTCTAYAQDTATYKLRLSQSLLDLPQNADLPYKFPSMQQSLELSNNFYDMGYRGIDLLGDKLVNAKATGATNGKVMLNRTAKYLLSLGFVKYGSELPIPLGVWAHEEYHRAVLGVKGVSSENGNWLLSRWDGTVYGVSDEQLANLKEQNLNTLLYAYVSGVHAQNLSTQTNMRNDFYHKRTSYKNALYLYNAYYTWNYLKFSTSDASNTVKTDAPPHEDPNPSQRDFAGADFTAWAYDMFNPGQPYGNRDPFPGGEGVNRRVGFNDLSAEAQDFLQDQKKLSLINFINPAIFFVNRIQLSPGFSFNFMGQYVPTHFGNDIGMQVPMQVKSHNLLLGIHTYNNQINTYTGIDLGMMESNIDKEGKLQASVIVHAWKQPETQSYFDTAGKIGGAAEAKITWKHNAALASYLEVGGKTEGWQLGNPYLDDNVSLRVGLNFNVK